MFPDIPPCVFLWSEPIRNPTNTPVSSDNIRYDLLRTGNIQQTSNRILEKGFLDAVSLAYSQCHPDCSRLKTHVPSCLPQPPAPYYTLFPRTQVDQERPSSGSGSGVNTIARKENLISRYHLQDRVKDDSTPIADGQIGGKAVWEDTPEKREASLRERKAQMILAARQYVAPSHPTL